MTKVIHYNISLGGYEKQLKRVEVEFLYMMMSSAIIDIGQYIWTELAEFKE